MKPDYMRIGASDGTLLCLTRLTILSVNIIHVLYRGRISMHLPFMDQWLVILVMIVLVVMWTRGQSRIPTLVLRKFRVNPTNDGNPAIEISGRPSGLIAWLLTAMQLDTETTLTVTDLHLLIKSSSLSGQFNDCVPLPHLSSSHCGYSKPIVCLFVAVAVAIVFLIGGMNQRHGGSTIIFGLFVAALFVLGYFLSKKITIRIVTDGGVPLQLKFKPSVVEGVAVNIGLAAQAISLLNDKIIGAA